MGIERGFGVGEDRETLLGRSSRDGQAALVAGTTCLLNRGRGTGAIKGLASPPLCRNHLVLSRRGERGEGEGANGRNHLIAADLKDPAHQARRMLTYGEEVSRCDGLARVCIAAQSQACQDLHCTIYGRQKQR